MCDFGLNDIGMKNGLHSINGISKDGSIEMFLFF